MTSNEKAIPIALGFGPDANSSVVDVKDGKIVWIRPLRYNWTYDEKQYNPWKIGALTGAAR